MHGPIDEVYRRIRGNEVIEAKFGNNLDRGLSIIRSRPEVRDVQVFDNRVTIEFDTADRNPAALLQALVHNEVEVFSYAQKEPTLEDVFMMVTKGLVS